MSSESIKGSPWDDVILSRRQAKVSVLSIDDPTELESWSTRNPEPAPRKVSSPTKDLVTDLIIPYHDTSRYESESFSDESLADSPTRGDEEGDIAFIIENIKARNIIEDQLDSNFPGSAIIESLQSTTFKFISQQIKGSFATIKGASGSDSSIDWQFWGKLINDYDNYAQKHPKLLQRKLQLGIPTNIRGLVWQLMTKSKCKELENVYSHLMTRSSSYEKLITRDLNRTFPKLEYFQDPANQQALFNVVKAYSLHDPEVGYCQGISFIVGPLLLNMPEEEAFCVLVKLMKTYRFREMYTPQMYGLHIRLYQFDNLLADLLPVINDHFEKEGVKSSMYASQWFMTLFAYRFPLDVVFRIMDIVMGVGIEAVFRFSFAMLKRNQEAIIGMEFENLLDFLKTGLFDVYLNGNMDQLMSDAAKIKLSKKRVDKLKQDWEYDQKKVDPEYLSSEALRIQNAELTEQLKRMESAYEQLNMEHIVLANQYLEQSLLQEKMNDQYESMQEKINDYKSIIDVKLSEPMCGNEEMQKLAKKNIALVHRNVELEDRIAELEHMLVDIRMKYASSEAQKDIRSSRR